MAYGILKIFFKGILRRILLQLICFLLHFSKKLKKKNKQTKVYDHSGQATRGQKLLPPYIPRKFYLELPTWFMDGPPYS